MNIVIRIAVPDELIEREWREANAEGETTMTMDEWFADNRRSALDYMKGWYLDDAVEYALDAEAPW